VTAPPADISPVLILAGVAIVAALAGPPFVMGMAGKHRAALQGIFIPGAIVLVALSIYLGRSSSKVGLWVAAGAAGRGAGRLGVGRWRLAMAQPAQSG
jgi:hypothetical protein